MGTGSGPASLPRPCANSPGTRPGAALNLSAHEREAAPRGDSRRSLARRPAGDEAGRPAKPRRGAEASRRRRRRRSGGPEDALPGARRTRGSHQTRVRGSLRAAAAAPRGQEPNAAPDSRPAPGRPSASAARPRGSMTRRSTPAPHAPAHPPGAPNRRARPTSPESGPVIGCAARTPPLPKRSSEAAAAAGRAPSVVVAPPRRPLQFPPRHVVLRRQRPLANPRAPAGWWFWPCAQGGVSWAFRSSTVSWAVTEATLRGARPPQSRPRAAGPCLPGASDGVWTATGRGGCRLAGYGARPRPPRRPPAGPGGGRTPRRADGRVRLPVPESPLTAWEGAAGRRHFTTIESFTTGETV